METTLMFCTVTRSALAPSGDQSVTLPTVPLTATECMYQIGKGTEFTVALNIYVYLHRGEVANLKC